MENIGTIDGSISQESGIELNELDLKRLNNTAKWGKFLAILGFISSGFLVIFTFVFIIAGSTIGAQFGTGMSAVIGIIYFVLGVSYFFPSLFLLKFCNGILNGVRNRTQEMISEGIKYLNLLFKYIGIFTIAMIIAYFIFVFVLVIMGVAGAL